MFRFNASGTPTETTSKPGSTRGADPSAPCGANFGEQLDSDGQRLVIGAKNWQNVAVGLSHYTGASGELRSGLEHRRNRTTELGSSVSVLGDSSRRVSEASTSAQMATGTVARTWPGDAVPFAGGVWNEEATLYNPVPETGDRMGHSVSIEGDFVISGAIGGDPTVDLGDGPVVQTDAGEVHVFRYASATDDWGHEQTISGSDVDQYDQFGRTVSIRGGQIAVGAVFEAILGAEEAGAAYVYR